MSQKPPSERRQKTILTLIFLVIVGICAWGIATSTATRAEQTIRIGILASRDDEDYAGALAFQSHVEAASQNRIKVKIYTSGQYCGSERECIENLQIGVLDIFMTTFGGFGNFYGAGQVFDLPYTFRDDAMAECALDGPILAMLANDVREAGLGMRLMTIGNTGGWRDFATTKKAIRTPSDLKGLKIRTTPAPLEQQFVRELGANPTPIGWSEVYLALATGVVEGTKNSVQDIVGMKLQEHIKFITTDHHAYMGAMWWYSERNWAELPADLQAIITQGFAQLKQITRTLPKEGQALAFEKFRAAGGNVYQPTPQDWAAFRAASSGMRAWYIKNYGDVWLKRLDEATAACDEASRSNAPEPQISGG